MVETEPWTPIGRIEQSLKNAHDVDETVAHQKEKIDNGRYVIDTADQDSDFGDEASKNQSAKRFVPPCHYAEGSKKRNHIVTSDGLQESWCT